VTRPRLILASASPRRLALLEQIGLRPDAVEPADIDETILRQELPRAHAVRVARVKALAVQSRIGSGADACILAADTVVACGRRILPKAENAETVETCLLLLSGRRHRVMTAVAVIGPDGRMHTRVCETQVAFRRLEQAEIRQYALSGEGLGKAGGYAIQGRAAIFVRFMGGSYSNVVGLPLTETYQMLKTCGAV
jgi:septum formation protein